MSNYSYKTSVSLSDGIRDYTVQELLDLKDDDFRVFYDKFTLMLSKKYDECKQDIGKTLFIFSEASFVTGVVERLVLERRIKKLELAQQHNQQP